MNRPSDLSSLTCFTMSMTASVVLITFAATQWWLVDVAGPMIFFLPFIYLTIVVFFGASVVLAIAQLRRLGRRGGQPAIVCLIAGLTWWFVPFTWLWVKANYRLHRTDREEIVAKITAGTLQPNLPCCPSLIALGPHSPYVSTGGNEVMVEEHDGHKYVMFYTFRGILDNYSGFLFVPAGGDPAHFSDLNETNNTELIRFSDRWFWASHR
jgi:hypothetical protein